MLSLFTTTAKRIPALKNVGTQTRGFRVVAGRNKQPTEQLWPSPTKDMSQSVLTDTSGYHAVCAVKSCPTEPQCGKRLCDSIDENKCPYASTDSSLVAARAGTLTHKLPTGSEGILLSITDGNAKPAVQYMATEKAVIPIDLKNFQENEKMAEYVQQPDIAMKIKEQLPPKSALFLKETSVNDTPFDENA